MTHITFDPRSKLATVFVASLLLMSRATWQLEGLFVSFLLILLWLNGGRKKGLVLFGLFWVLFIIDTFYFNDIRGAVSAFISFLLVGNRLMLPPIMAAVFASNQTKVSEWVAAMKKCRVPDVILIPFIVVCRFFPTLIEDAKRIRNAMKFRGIAVSKWELIKHPLQTLEFIIVPILMSVENTSLDLSAAALVRGLGNPGMHTSIYEVSMKKQDYILLLILVGILVIGGILL